MNGRTRRGPSTSRRAWLAVNSDIPATLVATIAPIRSASTASASGSLVAAPDSPLRRASSPACSRASSAAISA
jgi:hypothetical protein